MKDKCGIFGIYGESEASKLTYFGLYALQHRGQEGAGIVSCDRQNFYDYKAMGLVCNVFKNENLDQLKGNIAIGHVRYSTAGMSTIRELQPILVNGLRWSFAIAHNGNLVNYIDLKNQLKEKGAIFQSTSDSEVIAHLIAQSKQDDIKKAIVDALRYVKGAYSLVMLVKNNFGRKGLSLIGIKDPYGFRPLCLGKLKNAYILASESCALDILGAKLIREIDPGEMILISDNGIESFHPFTKIKHALCVFELIYFSRPDSIIFGADAHTIRVSLGEQLAKESPANVDLVISVPDSSNAIAIGYARRLGIPFEMGLIRNHYVGRTFIEPKQSIRDFGAKIKYNPLKTALKGKRITVVDDSIVRGTTSKKIVKMIRKEGAKEVHMRIGSPPIMWPCHYGIDTPTRNELIASSYSVEKIRRHIGADSLRYLSIEGLLKAVHSIVKDEFCLACFNGKYPISFREKTKIIK